MVWGLLITAFLNSNTLLSEPPKSISEIACQELSDKFQDYFDGKIKHNPFCAPYYNGDFKNFLYVTKEGDDILKIVYEQYNRRGIMIDEIDEAIEAMRLADRNLLEDETLLRPSRILYLVNRDDYIKLMGNIRKEALIKAIMKNMKQQYKPAIRYRTP